MRVQRNQDDQRWKYRTYHLRRLCRHHLKNVSFSSKRKFRGIANFEKSINYKNHDYEESRFSRNHSIREIDISSFWIFELSTWWIEIFGDLPVPLFWSLSLPRRLSNSGWTESFSSFMWTPARTPVPEFSVIHWILTFSHFGFSFHYGILFHDSVPNFPERITELKIMKIIFPSKLILQKRNLWNI